MPAHQTFLPLKKSTLSRFSEDYQSGDVSPEQVASSTLIEFDRLVIGMYNAREERFHAYRNLMNTYSEVKS